MEATLVHGLSTLDIGLFVGMYILGTYLIGIIVAGGTVRGKDTPSGGVL